MYIPSAVKVDKAKNEIAGKIHWLRETLPNDDVREQERQGFTNLELLGGALMCAEAECGPLGTKHPLVAAIRASWCAFWYNRELDRYIRAFRPLIVNRLPSGFPSP